MDRLSLLLGLHFSITCDLSQGTILYQWWFFKLTDQGLMRAAIIFCRFILIIFYSTILTVTTTPLSLADAVEKILYPTKNY